MSTVAKKENKDLEALYSELAWPLYAKYGHAYDAFKAALKYVPRWTFKPFESRITIALMFELSTTSAVILNTAVGFAFNPWESIVSPRKSLRGWILSRAQGRSF